MFSEAPKKVFFYWQARKSRARFPLTALVIHLLRLQKAAFENIGANGEMSNISFLYQNLMRFLHSKFIHSSIEIYRYQIFA